ncbi:MAG: glycosyltransferase family 4 protein [Deltaproteobacteria bacterium]|nr:glycosyltransferase family 4 protein [Deltaproteobacteria bacterium]
MKIVQIGTIDTEGGAAKVAYDLHCSYRRAGHDSKMLVAQKYGNDPNVLIIPSKAKSSGAGSAGGLYNWLDKLKGKLERDMGMQYMAQTTAGELLRSDAVRDADIVHFHNTHGGFLNLWAVSEMSRRKRVVWTLHDQWALTGHCAYSFACERWKTGCGACPDLKIYPAISVDTTRILWKLKARAYKKGRFTVTAPSKWLYDMLPQSMFAENHKRHILNAVDTEIFKPMDRAGIRSALGVPQDRFVITFAANFGATNPFKGFQYLREALRRLSGHGGYNPYLLVIGSKKKNPPAEDLAFEGMTVGFIKDYALMARYTAASDLYVVPSIAENSPLVVLESLACGTPVAAFDVGGVPELVRHKDTGYVARYKDSDDLAAGIGWFMELGKEGLAGMRQRCAEFINERHTLKQQTGNFLRLYEELLTGDKR